MRSGLQIILGVVLLSISTSCQEKQEARHPVTYSGGTFITESAKRSKDVLLTESRMIEDLIKKDAASKYYQSKNGFYYKYHKANITDTITPKSGDVVYIDFDIKSLDGEVIYTREETQPDVYIVDKQEIMVGLRHAIKLMRTGEIITFVFPSHMAYGMTGDHNKIGQEQPIMTQVTLKEIKKP